VALLGGLVTRRLVTRVLRSVLVIVVLCAAYLSVTFVQVWLTSRHSDPHLAQAIVVMGAAQYNGVPSPDLAARLSEADDLWRRQLAPLLVVTGGKQPGDVYTEAQASAMWLEARGVPSADIVEVGGSNSWFNLADAATLLHQRGVDHVLLVTDGFHEDRSLAIATDVGLAASPVPAVDSPIRGWSMVPYFAKETVGVGVGRIIGYRHLDLLHDA